MAAEYDVTAKTLDEALEQVADKLGVNVDELEYEDTSEEDSELVSVHVWVQPAEDDESQGVSEEELDHIADTAIAFLRDVLAYFGAQNAEIDEYEGDEGELILDIVGDDLAILIGRYGRTLQALQQLTTSIVNKKLGFKYPVVVDVEGYKNRRRAKLESVAESAAERAVAKDKDVRLHPMNPYERRIIHITLRDNPNVDTFSEGEGANRRVVVHPV